MADQVGNHFSESADCVKCGDLDKAVALFDKALVLESENDMVWALRGSFLEELGRFAEALTSFDRALAIRQDYEVTWYGRGRALRRLGRYDDAIASFDRALALNPAYADARKHRELTVQERDSRKGRS